jgi:PhzF family phenazine biosynthesis protein
MVSSLKRVELFQIDAFTDQPFGGNPAGVVPDATGLTAAEMQLIAREMNVSETAA